MKFYKYHGAGNDFLIADGRETRIDLDAEKIAALCNRHTGFGSDGVMVLEDSEDFDFRMRYYNSDGSGGMMCGNGGRCIVAFAADLGFRHFRFEAPDGPHEAELISGEAAAFTNVPKIVRLGMKNVSGAMPYYGDGGCDWFLDTGTRHLVRFVDDIDKLDVVGEGHRLRYDSRFAPVGVNVNFVKVNTPRDIVVRTYEKGVEDETLACGTGITASAMASWIAWKTASGLAGPEATDVLSGEPAIISGPVECSVRARIADLKVNFTPTLILRPGESPEFSAVDVFLTGPAVFVGTVSTHNCSLL